MSASTMLSDPAAAAWTSFGCPSIDAPEPVDGLCGRCGITGPSVPSSSVISEKFANFDSWPYGWRRLCVPCAWAYSRPLNSQLPMLITTTQVAEFPEGSGLFETLSSPLPHDLAAVIPIRRLRKRRHVLPTAQWGHLAMDKLVLPWDRTAADRLVDLQWIRTVTSADFRQLTRAAPPIRFVTSLPPDQWDRMIDAWTNLQDWRDNPTVWAAAYEITGTDPAP